MWKLRLNLWRNAQGVLGFLVRDSQKNMCGDVLRIQRVGGPEHTPHRLPPSPVVFPRVDSKPGPRAWAVWSGCPQLKHRLDRGAWAPGRSAGGGQGYPSGAHHQWDGERAR